MWFNIYFIIVFIEQVTSFSFDTDYPLVFDNPDSNDKNYFGYSIVIHQGKESSFSW